jgi:HTH-type transcriptional regulator / antitoxin HigA
METDLKSICSEADYEKALAEVEALWGAGSGTPEGERLDVLATLIDAYEEKHYPMGRSAAAQLVEIYSERRIEEFERTNSVPDATMRKIEKLIKPS